MDSSTPQLRSALEARAELLQEAGEGEGCVTTRSSGFLLRRMEDVVAVQTRELIAGGQYKNSGWHSHAKIALYLDKDVLVETEALERNVGPRSVDGPHAWLVRSGELEERRNPAAYVANKSSESINYRNIVSESPCTYW